MLNQMKPAAPNCAYTTKEGKQLLAVPSPGGHCNGPILCCGWLSSCPDFICGHTGNENFIVFQEMRETKSGMRALPSHYLTVGKKLYQVEIPDYDLISNPGIMPWTVTKNTAKQYKANPHHFTCAPDFTTKRAAQAYIDNVLSKKYPQKVK
jgi:hypothetical protein